MYVAYAVPAPCPVSRAAQAQDQQGKEEEEVDCVENSAEEPRKAESFLFSGECPQFV